MNHADYWIKRLNLTRHAEGGYFRETYRSAETIQLNRFDGPRAMSTAIYFLLNGDERSRLHRLKSDEVWHFYRGSSLTLHIIDQKGIYSPIRLGHDHGAVFQAVVPAGCWFGATVDDPESFALVGCTVAPGFDFHDFELGNRNELINHYPEHTAIIEKLTSHAD